MRTIVLGFSLGAMLLISSKANAQARQAVPRQQAQVVVGSRHYSPYYFYRPYYYGSFYYGYPYWGFGAGWSPYWFGGPYPYYPYYGPAYYGYSYAISSVRLQVQPRDAEVFIDGYYAGTVDDFDGTFQRLHLRPGEHDLEVFMPGHRSYTQKVYLQPGGTFRVKHALEPLAPGEPEPARPVGKTPPPGSQSRQPRGPQSPISPAVPDRDNTRGNTDFGSLSLRVQPDDASITINGDPWSGGLDQERLVIQLGEGTHTVEIRKDGYRSYITDITIRANETTTLNVSLTRQ